jgi:hypothetical protein
MKTTSLLGATLAVALLALSGCGHHSSGSPDSGVDAGVIPPCVPNPVSYTDILNACTTAQTGDPAKDYPYFPALADGGALPPLP